MCNFKNTIYACGCEIIETTEICGYIHDNITECMNCSQSEDVIDARACGREVGKKGSGPRCCPSPAARVTFGTEMKRVSSGSSGEWSEDQDE